MPPGLCNLRTGGGENKTGGQTWRVRPGGSDLGGSPQRARPREPALENKTGGQTWRVRPGGSDLGEALRGPDLESQT